MSVSMLARSLTISDAAPKCLQVFADLKGAVRPDALVLSILAGVPLAQFVNGLGMVRACTHDPLACSNPLYYRQTVVGYSPRLYLA